MTRLRSPRFPLALLAVIALTSCSTVGGLFSGGEKKPLPGERLSVLSLEKELEPENPALAAQGFVAPEPWRNEFWPQAGGYPNHAMQNLDLNAGPLKKVWQAKIGTGASKSLPMTAQPVVVDGKIFTLDTDSHLRAFSTADGKQLWEANVRPEGEDDPVIGGGIAYSAGSLYTTTGYNEVLALSPDDGKVLWRVTIPAPARAAPAVMDSRVFVATLDNRLLALEASDGALLWDYAGIGEVAGLVGAASPAANNDIVVPAFSSGEVVALRVENGAVAWSDNLSAVRRADNLAGLSDISGLPVIDKGVVFAVSYGGRLVAIDERTGSRVWQRDIGGSETPWIAGNHLFIVSANNKLVALGRDNGTIRWVAQLDKGDKDAPSFWTGPVYAGGRLILTASDGQVVEAAPDTGKLLRTWKAGQPVSVPPLVANATLYLLTDDGVLSAWR